MRKSIPCPVQITAAATPQHPALCDETRTLSYGQLDTAVDRLIAGLNRHGVISGDVLAVLAENSIEYAVLFFAAMRAGFILMPLNIRLSEPDWREQIVQSHCKLLVYDSAFGEKVRSLPMDTAAIAEFDLYGDAAAASAADSLYDLGHDAVIFFTSGSTGSPRGVLLTWSNLYYSAFGVQQVLGYTKEDCWLAVLPFFHVGGISILMRMALVGGTTCIMSKFRAPMVLRKIADKGIAYLSVVPTMLDGLMRQDAASLLSSLKAIIVGGAAFDSALRQEAVSRELPVLTTYGMTETASMVTLLPKAGRSDRLTTSGKALPFREIRIVGEQSETLSPGQTGKIQVRGEVLFSRYLSDTASRRDSDGWFEAGDIGQLDSNGYLTVFGRHEDLIVSGGENIDLKRIEQAIRSLAGVSDVVVMGRPDKKWGARPVAFVVSSDPHLDQQTILDTISPVLPRIMIPDTVVVVSELPLTGSGKYDRQALRLKFSEVFQERA